MSGRSPSLSNTDSGYTSSGSSDIDPSATRTGCVQAGAVVSPPPAANVLVSAERSPACCRVLNLVDVVDGARATKMNQIFIRAALAGNFEQITDMLQHSRRALVDLDAKDLEGNTALIYASAFAFNDIVKALLEAGAVVDTADSSGWTALFWACTNKHLTTTRILLSYNAAKDHRSALGRSIPDLIGKPDSLASRTILALLDAKVEDDLDDVESVVGSDWSIEQESTIATSVFGDYDELDEADDNEPFSYLSCRANEMLVFDIDAMDEILNVAVIKIWLAWLDSRASSKKKRAVHPHQAANVTYLCARFAGYHCSQSILQEFLAAVVERVCGVVRSNKEDQLLLAFWMSNLTLLLHHLKRDPELVLHTLEAQSMIAELIGELYVLFVRAVQIAIGACLEGAVIAYDGELDEPELPSSGGLRRPPRKENKVKYENSLLARVSRRKDFTSKFLRIPSALSRSTSVSPTLSTSPTASEAAPPPRVPSPRMMRPHHSSTYHRPGSRGTSTDQLYAHPSMLPAILNRALQHLRSAYTHPHVLNMVCHNVLHHLSATLFNMVLTSTAPLHPCSKSAALRMHLNLSPLREWVRDSGRFVPSSARTPLAARLQPVIDLCRFVGIITTLESLPDLLETKPPALSYLHLCRVLDVYRYEVGERTVNADIGEYLQAMRDTLVATVSGELGQADRVELEEDGIPDARRDPLVDLLDTDWLLPFQVPAPEDRGGWGAGGVKIDQAIWPLLGAKVPA
ncbi:hypothetical protein HDU89_002610 [Geranomyces variabilis]|nr:hypothetical protein HDU89_002610 [Geranomyces variabilis]